jgi:hypothetical protein
MCPDGADLCQRTIAQTVNFSLGIIRKAGGDFEIAEIPRHPVEQRRGVFIGERRLSYSGNSDDVISAFGECRKEHQRAAYRGDPSRLAGTVGEVAAHAAQLIVDDGLVTPSPDAHPGERQGRDPGENSHDYLAVPTMRAVEQ